MTLEKVPAAWKMLPIRVPAELHQKLKLRAVRENTSMQAIVIDLLRRVV